MQELFHPFTVMISYFKDMTQKEKKRRNGDRERVTRELGEKSVGYGVFKGK